MKAFLLLGGSLIAFSSQTSAQTGPLDSTGALAAAQSPAPAPTTEKEPIPIESAQPEGAGDIIVSALRRDSRLQDTPAAITAFNSKAIESAGIERPADFIHLTPNVQLIQTQNAGSSFVIVRGITQNRNTEPSVAVVVDGVQQVNAAQFNQELFDIEQIEVLKGPQGALYGRNAIGGAIVIKTKQPTDVLEGSAMAGIDNGFGYTLRASLSGPLSDTVKFRVAGSWRDTDGYLPNTYLHRNADPVKDFSARATLLWEPTSSLKFDLRGSVSLLKTGAFYYTYTPDVNNASLPIRTNNPGQDDRNIYNASLKIDYTADWGSIRSVSSYDQLSEYLAGDAPDGMPIKESLYYKLYGFDVDGTIYLKVKAFSQDLRISSRDNERLSWSAGGYFIATDRYISSGSQFDYGNGIEHVTYKPSANPLSPQLSFLADQQHNFAWAGYGNVGYQILDELRIDTSLRYDRDRRKDITLTPPNFIPVVPGFDTGATGDIRRRTFSAWQPKATLTWKVSPRLTLYGGYSRGFRSGGFNQSGVGAIATARGIVGVSDYFDAETADTFEAGLKSSFLNNTLTFNASGFTTKSRNGYFFVYITETASQTLGNVPEVALNGFELESTLRPVRGLNLNAALGVTYSDIRKFPDPSVIGNEAPSISRYTLNLGGQYESSLGGSGITGRLRVDYTRTGRTWFDVQNSTSRNPINVVDARASIERNGFRITAYAKNLFNERYNAEFSPPNFVFRALPRIYGLEVAKNF